VTLVQLLLYIIFPVSQRASYWKSFNSIRPISNAIFNPPLLLRGRSIIPSKKKVEAIQEMNFIRYKKNWNVPWAVSPVFYKFFGIMGALKTSAPMKLKMEVDSKIW
jgi:hypothetical protein